MLLYAYKNTLIKSQPLLIFIIDYLSQDILLDAYEKISQFENLISYRLPLMAIFKYLLQHQTIQLSNISLIQNQQKSRYNSIYTIIDDSLILSFQLIEFINIIIIKIIKNSLISLFFTLLLIILTLVIYLTFYLPLSL